MKRVTVVTGGNLAIAATAVATIVGLAVLSERRQPTASEITPLLTCETPPAAKLEFDPQYTPVEGRFGGAAEPAIAASGRAVDAELQQSVAADAAATVLASKLGQSRVRAEVEADTTQLYFGPAVTARTNREEYLASGGIVVSWAPGNGSFVASLPERLPGRVLGIDLGGGVTGAVAWADPLAGGLRPYAIAWSDGTTEYRLEVAESGERAVELAAAIVCQMQQAQ